jgi:chromosome partitioning protein
MIIAFAGQKGGAGKSTAAISVACEWHARGHRVLLVDGDPQGTASTWAAVASEASRQPPAVVAMGATMHQPGQLARVGAAFDRIVIDCPPRHDAIQRSALMVADVAILPCGPSASDAWALAAGIALVVEAQALRPTLRAAVLLTRLSAATALSRGARGVVEGAGLPVLRASLGYRVAFAEALAAGQGPAQYAPGDVARLEVEHLVDELEQLAGVILETSAHVA